SIARRLQRGGRAVPSLRPPGDRARSGRRGVWAYHPSGGGRQRLASQMAPRRRRVVWTEQARQMLDDAVSYVARDSRPPAARLLIQALETASSLNVQSERGRVVPELDRANIRQLLVQRYRLLYAVTPAEVQILAFVHGARDLTGRGLEG